MKLITSEKQFIAANWIDRVMLKKHPKYRLYLRCMQRSKNDFKQF